MGERGIEMVRFALLTVMALVNCGLKLCGAIFLGSVRRCPKSPTENGWVPDAPLIPIYLPFRPLYPF